MPQVPNVVVLTGDIHLAAVAQLRAGDRATGTPVGAEFITTSISSDGSDQRSVHRRVEVVSRTSSTPN